jgi:hypothetical protein
MILEEIRNFVMIEILDVTRVSYSEMNFFVSFYEKSYPGTAFIGRYVRTYVAFVHLSIAFVSLKNWFKIL